MRSRGRPRNIEARKKVIQYIKENQGASYSRLKIELNIPDSTLTRILNEFKDMGILVKDDHDKWYIKEYYDLYAKYFIEHRDELIEHSKTLMAKFIEVIGINEIDDLRVASILGRYLPWTEDDLDSLETIIKYGKSIKSVKNIVRGVPLLERFINFITLEKLGELYPEYDAFLEHIYSGYSELYDLIQDFRVHHNRYLDIVGELVVKLWNAKSKYNILPKPVYELMRTSITDVNFHRIRRLLNIFMNIDLVLEHVLGDLIEIARRHNINYEIMHPISLANTIMNSITEGLWEEMMNFHRKYHELLNEIILKITEIYYHVKHNCILEGECRLCRFIIKQ